MKLCLFECETCGWYSQSADYSWGRHAGVVHSEILCTGHVVQKTEPLEEK